MTAKTYDRRRREEHERRRREEEERARRRQRDADETSTILPTWPSPPPSYDPPSVTIEYPSIDPGGGSSGGGGADGSF